jgi:predicted RNA-binding protein (virulence factor B family)
MVEIGKYNTLRIIKILSFGAYLDGGDGLEILLPTRYVPQDAKVDDNIEVFIYHDNEGRLIATTAKPLAVAGEFQFMEVKSVNKTGAFLEWGLMKDLLVPFKEQKMPMKEGKWYLVYVHVDHVTKRIVASARIDKYLDNVIPNYTFNQEVDLLVADETEIGYKVIINNTHWGLVYRNEIFQRLEKGDHLKGYIKEVREDEKIDVSLTPLGYQKVEGIANIILESLKAQGGFIAVHDKSDPDLIYSLFRCSKKAFKQAIGSLYKQKLITIEPQGIKLVSK